MRSILASFLCLAAATGLSAQARATPTPAGTLTPDKIARCVNRIVPVRESGALAVPEYQLSLRASYGSRLVLLGLTPTRDSLDVQIRNLQVAWNEEKPTAAFYEGAATSTGVSVAYSAQKYGESSVVRYLAGQTNLPLTSMDPSRFEEADALLKTYPKAQVAMYMALRIPITLRDTRGITGAEFADTLRLNVDRVGQVPALTGVFANVDAFKAAYLREFGGDPLTAPVAWFDPVKPSNQTGSHYLNDLSRAYVTFRNQYTYRTIASGWSRGARLFAVVERSRVPALAPALRCALGG